jgi:hypothetical protein
VVPAFSALSLGPSFSVPNLVPVCVDRESDGVVPGHEDAASLVGCRLVRYNISNLELNSLTRVGSSTSETASSVNVTLDISK